MRVVWEKILVVGMGTLFLTTLYGKLQSACHRPWKKESAKSLGLSYEEFDQQPGGGWRKSADAGNYFEAAEVIELYMQEKKHLKEWQRRNLLFHAGQLYAFAQDNKRALQCCKLALNPTEPPDAPIRWNAYVRATMAFLQRDRESLSAYRDEIAKGPELQGAIPNLEVVNKLVELFDESYSHAYRGKKAVKSPHPGNRIGRAVEQ